MYVKHNSVQPRSLHLSFSGSRTLLPASSSLGNLPRYRTRRIRRSLMLGDDAAAILTQVFQGQSGAPAAANVQQVVQQAMSQGSLYTTENCTGIQTGASVSSAVLSAGGGIAVKFGTTAIAAGASGPLAPIVLAVGGLMTLFGAIFGHHAAKVKQEQQIICAVVASINDSLATIDQLLSSGQITVTQAGQALDSLYSQLQQNVQPILKQDSSHCNAACFILAEARGVILQRKDQYSHTIHPGGPQGTYAQTCRNMVVTGDVMTAQCQDSNFQWQNTTLPSIAACMPGSVYNQNGMLGCPLAQVTGNGGQGAAGSSTSAGSTSSFDLSATVENLAAQIGIPSWSIWALGTFLAVRMIS